MKRTEEKRAKVGGVRKGATGNGEVR